MMLKRMFECRCETGGFKYTGGASRSRRLRERFFASFFSEKKGSRPAATERELYEQNKPGVKPRRGSEPCVLQHSFDSVQLRHPDLLGWLTSQVFSGIAFSEKGVLSRAGTGTSPSAGPAFVSPQK